jgi:hypothetical protein
LQYAAEAVLLILAILFSILLGVAGVALAQRLMPVQRRKPHNSAIGTLYGARFVHHGHTIDELEIVRRFMLETWVLFTKLASFSRRFGTKEQLIDHLDAMKLS